MNTQGIGCHASSLGNIAASRQQESSGSVQQFEDALKGTQSSRCGSAQSGSDQTDASIEGQNDSLSQLQDMLKMLMPLLQDMVANLQKTETTTSNNQNSVSNFGQQQQENSQCEACNA